ncbi:hypothetical protein G7046_g9277 [Stylonectria norvegica]|nr:hypothetical protein G7046_g9277 [Stylonectria norvegica]
MCCWRWIVVADNVVEVENVFGGGDGGGDDDDAGRLCRVLLLPPPLLLMMLMLMLVVLVLALLLQKKKCDAALVEEILSWICATVAQAKEPKTERTWKSARPADDEIRQVMRQLPELELGKPSEDSGANRGANGRSR